MNEIIKRLARAHSNRTLSLKKHDILIEKPWAFLDDDGEIQKLIFKKDKDLILSKNGKVIVGAWDYFPEAKSLLIDRGFDKLLLNEMFVDENVLVLKKDGSKNEFFTLANENTVPDLNVPRYLNSKQNLWLDIREVKLLDGNTLQIIHGRKDGINNYRINGFSTQLRDDNFKQIDLLDGKYLSKNLYRSYIIKDKKIVDYYKNVHELSNGQRVITEQKKDSEIHKGDKLLEYSTGSLIPDGKYKIKGKLKWIKVKNSIVISSLSF